MKPKTLLRIAAVLMLLHAVGHTFGAVGWARAPNSKVAAVIHGMQSEHFNFMGRRATLAQFYSGYGISLILILLYFSAQLWLLASNPAKPMLLLLALGLSGLMFCEYIYFFPFAALFTAISAICTGISYARQPNELN